MVMERKREHRPSGPLRLQAPTPQKTPIPGPGQEAINRHLMRGSEPSPTVRLKFTIIELCYFQLCNTFYVK